MKRFTVWLLPIAATMLLTIGYAQKSAKPAKTEEEKPAAPTKKPVLEVALGKGSRSGGEIAKGEFDVTAPQGIRIKDPKGAYIEGFSFTYGERNLYEDSAGNPVIITDYLTEYCMGDTLSTIISHTIATRTKPGDTAYYDDIHIRMADGKTAKGKAMKFVIK